MRFPFISNGRVGPGCSSLIGTVDDVSSSSDKFKWEVLEITNEWFDHVQLGIIYVLHSNGLEHLWTHTVTLGVLKNSCKQINFVLSVKT